MEGAGGGGGACFLYKLLQRAGNAPSFSTAITEVPGASSDLFLEDLTGPGLRVLAPSLELESGSPPDAIL